MVKFENNRGNFNKYKKYSAIFGVLTAVLIMTNTTAIWLWQRTEKAAENETAANNRFNLLNPARKFTNQKDLIINFQSLREYLNTKYEADQNVSIYFEYLPTGANIAISKDAEFYPASLLKVPVAMAVAKKVERGEWKWTNELVLMTTDKDDKFGDLYKEKTNSTFTIEELVRRSLLESDNTANFILVRNLEVEEIKDVYDHMGLIGFLKTDGKLSAKRYSVIFRTLYNASYLSEENSQKLLSYLSQSPFKEYIQSVLPSEIVFAHKIGVSADEELYLDSGIVYAENRPYLLVVIIKSNTEQKAKEKMKDISGRVYDYVKDFAE